MLNIETEIQGLTFIQADIFGKPLPSRTSIESVLDKITDKRNKRKICDRSNSVVLFLHQKYNLPINLLSDHFHDSRLKELSGGKLSLNDIHKILLHITELQCRLSGDDYYLLVQNLFNVEWFELLFCDFNFDIQKIRKAMTSYLACAYGNGNIETFDKYNNMKPEISSSNMIQYPEYMSARAYSHAFDSRICKIALYDVRMSIYMIFSVEIMNKVFKGIKQCKNTIHEVFCTECQTYFTSQRMPILKVCLPCQKKLREEKKMGRRIDRKGWKFDRLGDCKYCENKRKINTCGSCLKCYLLNL
jgi:hypothetical protein